MYQDIIDGLIFSFDAEEVAGFKIEKKEFLIVLKRGEPFKAFDIVESLYQDEFESICRAIVTRLRAIKAAANTVIDGLASPNVQNDVASIDDTAGWLKLDSAPKDGTPFLARYGKDGVSIARFSNKEPEFPLEFIDSHADGSFMINRSKVGEYCIASPLPKG